MENHPAGWEITSTSFLVLTQLKLDMKKSLIFCCLLFVINIQSQETENLIQEMSFYKDKTNQYSIHTINSANFISIEEKSLGINNATFWFKVTLKEVLSSVLIFDIKGNSLKNIEIYQNNKLLTTKEQDIGITHSILKVDSTEKEPFYLKVQFSRQVYFPLKVYLDTSYRSINKYDFFKSGFYYGFVVVVFIINLFFYISLKDETFLLYCVFLIAINLGISGYDGLSNLWIPKTIDNYTNVLFHFLIPLSGALFATSFLDLKRLHPKSIGVGIFLLLFPILSFILYLITEKHIFYALGDTLCLLALLFYWLMGVYVLKMQPYAKFFVIGYSLVLFTAFLFIIPQDFGLTHFSLSVEHVKFGALFEMLILTYAITYRVKILHQENTKFTEEIKTHITQILELEEQLKTTKNNGLQENSIEDKIELIANKHNLTERESDILLQIVNGLKNQQIAEKLFVSINTVKYHTRNIYEKLDVNKRTELASKLLFDK